ncbi:MAG: acyl-CoA dehydrogenase, partial [Rhodobacterales bacterium 17-64-5]
MDFNDTPPEAAYRTKVREWLRVNAPWHLVEEMNRERTVGVVSITSEDPLEASRAWLRKKAEAGFAAPGWPKEYGGAGMTPMERVIWQQEDEPFKQLGVFFAVGLALCGPTLMEWGTADQKTRLLPPMVRGEEMWCQLFSEPAAGSDLAGLRTRARRAEDGSGDWIIDGQKIWTSYAQFCDWGLLLARTDGDVAKHKGLTMFHIRLDSPGVVVRPIRQINGHSTFNEVFFNEVRLPDSNRIGGIDDGWIVSLTTLMNERATIGASVEIGFDELVALARSVHTTHGRAIDDPAVRSRLAHFACTTSGLKFTAMRAISALSRGEVPGPESSINKLVASEARLAIAQYGFELQAQA